LAHYKGFFCLLKAPLASILSLRGRGRRTEEKASPYGERVKGCTPSPLLPCGLLPTLKLRRTGTDSPFVLYGTHYSSHQHPSSVKLRTGMPSPPGREEKSEKDILSPESSGTF